MERLSRTAWRQPRVLESHTWMKACGGMVLGTLCKRTRELLELNRNKFKQLEQLLVGLPF
jgi:hypothetical protein